MTRNVVCEHKFPTFAIIDVIYVDGINKGVYNAAAILNIIYITILERKEPVHDTLFRQEWFFHTLTSYTVNVENPSDDFIAWCKENLTIPNPEYAKKVRMHFWLGNTPKVLTLYEVRGDTLILPFGTLRSLSQLLRNSIVESAFKSSGSVQYNGFIPLYDYQETAVQAAMDAKYGILQSPAGSGKTQMGIALVERYGRKALWLTHTLDLLSQSKARAEQYMDKSLIGTITEGRVHIGSGITFATIQTMCKLDLAQYKDLWDG